MLNLWNMLQENPNLFNGIELPDALDQTDIVNAILSEGAQLAPIYGDPDLLHQMIGHYFKTRLWIHQQLVDLLALKYDPISNYDRREESDEESGSKRDLDRTRQTDAEGTTGGTAGRSVSAYDSNTMQPSESSETTGESTSNVTDQTSEGEKEDRTRTFKSRITGNIGVTTSQQMIESSVELMGIMDVYRYIALDFLHTFCIMVY